MDVFCRSELIILLIHRSLSWVMPNNFSFLLQTAQPPGIVLWQKLDHATSSLSARGPAEPCPRWPLQHFPSHSLLTRQPTWVSSFNLLWPLSFPFLGICFIISSHSSLLFVQISAHICLPYPIQSGTLHPSLLMSLILSLALLFPDIVLVNSGISFIFHTRM